MSGQHPDKERILREHHHRGVDIVITKICEFAGDTVHYCPRDLDGADQFPWVLIARVRGNVVTRRFQTSEVDSEELWDKGL